MRLRLTLVLALLAPAHATADRTSAAEGKPEPTAAEVRAFMKQFFDYVRENHLKREESSEQRGMVYEYFDVKRKGRFDQWVQGEALDTMHDGAWLAAACVAAY